jgi:UDP-N-acetylglucosamine--N-acetylmuramyl-(pentapeptide) pyrophosphoryl-undecaprenol N-acetylglucosamine transferase
LSSIKKIYFSINGLGFGHSSRCNYIIQFLLKEKHKVYISTYYDGYNYFSNLYKNIINNKEIKYYFDDKGRLSFKITLSREFIKFQISWLFHLFIEFRNLLAIKPDVVICDSRISSVIASNFLGIKTIVITNQIFVEIPRIKPMNSFIKFLKNLSERIIYEIIFYWWRKSKYIIIPDIKPPYTVSSKNIRIKNIADFRKIIFIGPLIFLDKISNYKNNKEDNIITVLIAGTLQERFSYLKYILNLLNNSNLIYKYNIFTGIKYLKNFRKNNLNIFGYMDKQFIEENIHKSKALIVTGGHTSLFEAIFLEKPFIVFLLKGHTEKINNSISLKKMGACEIVFIEDLNQKDLEKLMENFLSNRYMYLNKILAIRDLLKEYQPLLTFKKLLNHE